MENLVREWPWPWDGYATVRLTVRSEILPPTRDQVASQVEAIVGRARTVEQVSRDVGAIGNPYLPLDVRVVPRGDAGDPSPGLLDLEARLRRR